MHKGTLQANKAIKIWNGKQNYFAVLIALLLKVEKLSKKVTAKTFFKIFLVSILFKKVREEKGGGGGYPSVALYSSLRTSKKVTFWVTKIVPNAKTCLELSVVPWHDCPSPVYPSLQVYLWEPLVLAQFALTSLKQLYHWNLFISAS